MNDQNGKFTLEIQTTDKKCPIGEITGKEIQRIIKYLYYHAKVIVKGNGRKRVKSAYGLTDIILRI